MSVQRYLQLIMEHLHSSASVKTVYGDPVTGEGKTIIPVAKVAYGFGTGASPVKKSEDSTEGEAGGAGGGICCRPVGIVEITKEETRFIPIDERRKLAGVLLIGLILGLWLGSRRSRK
jgi:uncharacterized spore protein YtfJ